MAAPSPWLLLAALAVACATLAAALAPEEGSAGAELQGAAGGAAAAGSKGAGNPGGSQSSSGPGNATKGDGSYVSDGAPWGWPTANDPNAENLIHSILSSWCADTYVDAAKSGQEQSAQLDKLRAERDQHYSEWIRCTHERGVRERELEMECEQARQVQAGKFESAREKTQSECDAEASQLKADIENCQVKLNKKGVGSCQKELQAARSACEHHKRGLQEALAACQGEPRASNVSRAVELEEMALRAAEERAAWAAQKKLLAAEVAECRPAQSKARRRLTEVLTDGKVSQLESKVLWLQLLLLNLLLAVGVTAGAVATQVLKEGSGDVEGGHGWIRTLPPARLQLVDAESARRHLAEAFEENKGSRLAIVLATDIFYTRRRGTSGPHTVFLLVPINITSARRFMLFNQGGDYTAHVARAREIVAASVENARLLVVLYEAGGCVFTEATLQSLRLTADKVAHEAIPADMDFPAADNLVVLWLDKQEGLRASDSTHESDALTENIKCQPWAQYLLMRSGRWGQVHAQFM